MKKLIPVLALALLATTYAEEITPEQQAHHDIRTLRDAGDHEAALAAAQQAMTDWPDARWPAVFAGQALNLMGRYDETVALLEGTGYLEHFHAIRILANSYRSQGDIASYNRTLADGIRARAQKASGPSALQLLRMINRSAMGHDAYLELLEELRLITPAVPNAAEFLGYVISEIEKLQ